MISVLVLCSQYPIPGDYSKGNFFHVRNRYYVENDIDVDVINFETEQDYQIDGIFVYAVKSGKIAEKKYDVIVCHAPNLRHHFSYLREHNAEKSKIVFVFHGNEVLDTYKIAPYRYPYLPSSKMINVIKRKIKDFVKLKLLRKEFIYFRDRSEFIFVSNWMKREMQDSINLKKYIRENQMHVINNAVGKPFEIGEYDSKSPKKYDFITIRAQLDGAKYCVDLVCELANRNPNNSFLVIGKGEYFKYNAVPENVTWLETTLGHEEILLFLNQARCALLLTRWDSQGLMTCETATYGMPTVTSDIPVCHEILDSFDNVRMINNDKIDEVDLNGVLLDMEESISHKKNTLYFSDRTMLREVELFNELVNRK